MGDYNQYRFFYRYRDRKDDEFLCYGTVDDLINYFMEQGATQYVAYLNARDMVDADIKSRFVDFGEGMIYYFQR